ncbi:MAG: hypothetical protein K6E13_02125 [Lachnospiraceae bacterium]|nr:hypothetical protein [Lachnospiraceae bacterium]
MIGISLDEHGWANVEYLMLHDINKKTAFNIKHEIILGGAYGNMFNYDWI